MPDQVTHDHFEKLYLIMPTYTIAIANCPDDFSKCSLVVSVPYKGFNDSFTHSSITHSLIEATELDQIIAALQAVRKDMPV